MQDAPDTHYAIAADGVHIAYQVFGEGPLDLVFVSSWISQIEHLWELPAGARFLSRLASFSRLITFDKRGSGLSDRVSGNPPLDERMDDIRAVMDAVGSKRAALFGTSEGGTLSAAFAATYPGRTIALIAHGSGARLSQGPDYPWGWSDQGHQIIKAYIEGQWGTGEAAIMIAPSYADDPEFLRWFGRLERLMGSPASAWELFTWNMEIDIRPILPVVAVPTLVLHRKDDLLVPVECGRHLAEHIAGAKYVELPGGDHYAFLGNVDDVVDEVQEFVTGMRPGPEPDRVLATVLFTDIVSSTETAAGLGDRRWKELLDQYDEVTRRQLDRHRGRLVKSTGDGLLATFDGPARAVRCAQAIDEATRSLGVQVKYGLHTGEVEIRGGDIGGIAVHIAARIMEQAGSGEVVVSSTVKDLVVGSGIEFADRGAHSLKGVPDEWHLFAVEG